MSRRSGFKDEIARRHPERSEAKSKDPVASPRVMKRGSSTSLGITVLLFLCATSLFAQEQSATSISQEVKDIFARCSRAVVKIHGVDEHSELCGTGFFVDPTGTLYTSYTVGGEASNFSVDFDGKNYSARQVLADIRSGIAMLKVDLATPALPIGKSDQLEIATPVVTVGYPLDLPETPSFGMIAGFDRKYLGRYFSTTHLRVNLPTQRGEAGAPLLNLKGEVVGIVVSSLENNSACYALPIDAAEKIRSDYVRFGEARHGWIGINVAEAKTPVEGSRAEMNKALRQPSPASNPATFCFRSVANRFTNPKTCSMPPSSSPPATPSRSRSYVATKSSPSTCRRIFIPLLSARRWSRRRSRQITPCL
jgi:S1-C subfamily serine protease